MNRNMDLLQKLKDYDADLVNQKAENAALEQQRLLAEVSSKLSYLLNHHHHPLILILATLRAGLTPD